MTDDTISRQAAIDALNDEYHGMISDESMKIYQIVEWLNTLPSAQPDMSEYSDKLWRNAYERGKKDAQRTGRWKVSDLPKGKMKYCSECGFGQYIADERQYGYCPNCGARMEEQE